MNFRKGPDGASRLLAFPRPRGLKSFTLVAQAGSLVQNTQTETFGRHFRVAHVRS